MRWESGIIKGLFFILGLSALLVWFVTWWRVGGGYYCTWLSFAAAVVAFFSMRILRPDRSRALAEVSALVIAAITAFAGVVELGELHVFFGISNLALSAGAVGMSLAVALRLPVDENWATEATTPSGGAGISEQIQPAGYTAGWPFFATGGKATERDSNDETGSAKDANPRRNLG